MKLKCTIMMIVDGKEFISKECGSYVEANKYKLFKEETDHRENVEYIIKEL